MREKDMKGRSGPGADGLQAILIQRSPNVILPVLVYFFNRIISNGVFFSTRRTSIIVPIFKGGSPRDLRVKG